VLRPNDLSPNLIRRGAFAQRSGRAGGPTVAGLVTHQHAEVTQTSDGVGRDTGAVIGHGDERDLTLGARDNLDERCLVALLGGVERVVEQLLDDDASELTGGLPGLRLQRQDRRCGSLLAAPPRTPTRWTAGLTPVRDAGRDGPPQRRPRPGPRRRHDAADKCPEHLRNVHRWRRYSYILSDIAQHCGISNLSADQVTSAVTYSGGDYFVCQGNAWLHVVPTFDPNSADGYGDQPLPPLCVRIPDQYTCATDGPPPN
jgi:hypothetical protein